MRDLKQSKSESLLTKSDRSLSGLLDPQATVTYERKRLQRGGTASDSQILATGQWMEEERRNIQAYEYLCHVGEAKEWIEACIKEKISDTVAELDECLRDGVLLAKLAKFFAPDCVGKIFEAQKLQFRHSDNINVFLGACRQVGLPEVFLFELTDLYEQKNMPKVIYCIHALSYFLSKRGSAPRIQNLVGKLQFTDAEIQRAENSLAEAGLDTLHFENIEGALANQFYEENEAPDLLHQTETTKTFEEPSELPSPSPTNFKIVNTICHYCHVPVVNEKGVRAMGYIFHHNHFLCKGCEKALKAEEAFLIHPTLDEPYHELCYEEKFLPKCGSCRGALKDMNVFHVIMNQGEERSFHIDCIKCGMNLDPTSEVKVDKPVAGCDTKLAKGFDLSTLHIFAQDNHVYCEPCYNGKLAPECAICHRRVRNELSVVISNPGDTANPPFYYFMINENPCQGCLEDSVLPTCSRCHAKIRKAANEDGHAIDTFVTVGTDTYHQACFSCFDCNKPFEGFKVFILEGNQYYCKEHYVFRALQALQMGEKAKN